MVCKSVRPGNRYMQFHVTSHKRSAIKDCGAKRTFVSNSSYMLSFQCCARKPFLSTRSPECLVTYLQTLLEEIKGSLLHGCNYSHALKFPLIQKYYFCFVSTVFVNVYCDISELKMEETLAQVQGKRKFM